ncbi:MAG: imidazolonepropionase [Bacteroidia bacterium]
MDLLLTNIKGLIQTEDEPRKCVKGTYMHELAVLENAFLFIENGKIRDFGLMENAEQHIAQKVDCSGRFVLPTFVDSHTHLVFAATREKEFEMRIKGATYEEIAAAGGGILNSAMRLQQTPENELYESARKRLHEVISLGTGAIEIKSGYGLSLEAELKMLRVIRRLKEKSPIPIKATFLGAHAFPAVFKQHHDRYIGIIIKDMLPQIAEEGLADYMDVFCERNYFSPEETARLLVAGLEHGLKPKIHVNQFSTSGGIKVAVEHKAVSVDHLEVLADEDLEALRGSGTIATLLPSCSFFLGLDYAPARRLMEADVPVALATDYNPGSTPSGNMPFVVSLACLRMKMTPAEAINAATLNGAAALEIQHKVGSISRGKLANVIITRKMDSLAYLPYAFGSGHNTVETVILNGKVWEE